MPCRKLDQGKCGERLLACVRFANEETARGGKARKQASNGFRRFTFSVTKIAAAIKFVALLALAVICWGAEISSAQLPEAERTSYAHALAYCRWNVPRPIAIREDKRVLCLDGQINAAVDLSAAKDLEQGGLFVVRSSGGEVAVAIELADLLLSKHATVIINQYCLANCANYLFIASVKAFVPKDALVAWCAQISGPGECVGFSQETSDEGAPRFHTGPCSGPFAIGRRKEYLGQLKRNFYEGRVVSFEEPPESLAIRRALRRRYEATGAYPYKFYWTWNPRFYANAIRTKVSYEAYPQSQDDVDTIAARIGIRFVIHDP